MERLTEHGYNNRFCLAAGVSISDAIDRLAAYEDTGLTPEEVTERVTAVKPYAESRADRLCGACYSYIDWDALNDRIEDAPKYCKLCGKPIDWSDEKGGNRSEP